MEVYNQRSGLLALDYPQVQRIILLLAISQVRVRVGTTETNRTKTKQKQKNCGDSVHMGSHSRNMTEFLNNQPKSKVACHSRLIPCLPLFPLLPSFETDCLGQPPQRVFICNTRSGNGCKASCFRASLLNHKAAKGHSCVERLQESSRRTCQEPY